MDPIVIAALISFLGAVLVAILEAVLRNKFV